MSYVNPERVLNTMIDTGAKKADQTIFNLLIAGFLGGAILAFATTLAFTATVQTGMGIVGAIIFPVGFVIIILLGLELVTGNFALIPLAVLEKNTTITKMFLNFFWVTVGHIIGCLFYLLLYYVSVTTLGNVSFENNGVVQAIINSAEAKTIGYKQFGFDGGVTVFVKAILCNWMVTLGVVMAMTSESTSGKIVAMWLPIFIFFAQGFEHAVVNLFVIPAGMMFGANVSFSDWWLWNQLPVLIGNLVGGFLFTGLFIYLLKKQGLQDFQAKSKVAINRKAS